MIPEASSCIDGYYMGCYRRSDLVCVVDSTEEGAQTLLWHGDGEGSCSYESDRTDMYLIMPDEFCRRWGKSCRVKCGGSIPPLNSKI